ncbi:MAG: PilZ domain-containing protein [Polyangiaceae bacterium]
MRQRYESKPEIEKPLPISFEVEGEPEPATGSIERLSLVGVDIETPRAPAVGCRIVFDAALDPHSPEVLAFAGRVRWVGGARIGVQFADLGAKETHAIVQAMATGCSRVLR